MKTRRRCKRKVSYMSFGVALAEAEALWKDLHRALRPYRCDFCREWHLHSVSPAYADGRYGLADT